MPELPVVQALAERLQAAAGGHVLEAIVPISFAVLKTVEPPPEALRRGVLDGVGRRGKYLVWTFGDVRLLMHLSQAGRIEIEIPPKTTRPRGAVGRLAFVDGPSVLMKEHGTERKAGWWILAEGDEGPLAELGPEPFDPAFALLVRTGSDSRRLHTILRDQRTVAGVGRGHADDALHRAMLSPMRSLDSLDGGERERLLAAVHEDLEIKLAQERERKAGLPSKLGEHWVVHARYGTPCWRCGETLQRVSYEGYEISYCPRCQTGGRTLADRRFSRFLK